MKLTDSQKTDLRYLRQFYGWDNKEAREVMQTIVESAHGARYYTALADAHRRGYRQTEENGYIRLQPWFASQGLPDPFADEPAPALERIAA
jgi:hypothetical protein